MQHKPAKWQRKLALLNVDPKGWSEFRNGWPKAWLQQRQLSALVNTAWSLITHSEHLPARTTLSYALVKAAFGHFSLSVSEQQRGLWQEILATPRPLKAHVRRSFYADPRRDLSGGPGMSHFVAEALFLLEVPYEKLYVDDVVRAVKHLHGYDEAKLCEALHSHYPLPRIP